MTNIVERLRKQAWQRSGAPKMDAGHAKMLEWEAADEIERLRKVIIRAKDALLDGQSTQWVHDLLVAALLGPKP